MKLEIISFGKIAELIHSQQLDIPGVSNTDELRQYLEKSFPTLSGMKYKIAVNQQIISDQQVLADLDKIAIMPPFSGG